MGCNEDPLLRHTLESILRTELSAAPRELTLRNIVDINLFGWEHMPTSLGRWAVLSCGMASVEELGEWHKCSDDEIWDLSKRVNGLFSDCLQLGNLTSVQPAVSDGNAKEELAIALPGEVSRLWLVSDTPSNDDAAVAGWCRLPVWMRDPIERQLRICSHRHMRVQDIHK